MCTELLQLILFLPFSIRQKPFYYKLFLVNSSIARACSSQNPKVPKLDFRHLVASRILPHLPHRPHDELAAVLQFPNLSQDPKAFVDILIFEGKKLQRQHTQRFGPLS